MNDLEKLKRDLPVIEKIIGYSFENKEILTLAFIHTSFTNEYKHSLEHNERLEFLGDSVLGLVVADYLYHRLPNFPEGTLSQLRSRLVDANACAHYLQKIDLANYIVLGRGELMSKGKEKPSILSDAFESLLGAIYLDGGHFAAKTFLLTHFEEDFEAAIEAPIRNYKAELQDLTQKKLHITPVYKVIQESGPDHAKTFHVMVYIGEKEAGIGIGSSKKQAEQRAAFEALAKEEEK